MHPIQTAARLMGRLISMRCSVGRLGTSFTKTTFFQMLKCRYFPWYFYLMV